MSDKKILYSKIYGAGKPILILHGLLGMGDNWTSIAKKIYKKDYEVHVLDLRNHGRSFNSNSWTYDDMVNDIMEYILFHKLKVVNILGHSMGGKVAMLFACMYPKKVDKLIVVDISPREYKMNYDSMFDALTKLNFKTITSRIHADTELSKYIPSTTLRQFLLKSLFWVEKEKLEFRFNLEVIKNNISNVGVAIPHRAYFRGETLFLRGSESNYITDEDVDIIYDIFPNSKVEKVLGAGHWLHSDKPKVLLEKVLHFF